MRILSRVALAIVLLTPLLGANEARIYTDPEKDFSIAIDDGWKTSRDRAKDHCSTALTTASGTAILNVHVYPMGEYAGTITKPETPPGVDPKEFEKTRLIEGSKPWMDVWVEGARKMFKNTRTGKIGATEFHGRTAARCTLRYDGADGKPRTGYALFFFGAKNVFFLTMTTRDKKGEEEVERALASLKIEVK